MIMCQHRATTDKNTSSKCAIWHTYKSSVHLTVRPINLDSNENKTDREILFQQCAS